MYVVFIICISIILCTTVHYIFIYIFYVGTYIYLDNGHAKLRSNTLQTP